MLKKRLIFILYFDSGAFLLSRNFRLQRVGDARWLVEKFRFKNIGRFIDEIVLLDVSRKPDAVRCGGESFAEALGVLMRETFVPLTLGGGIRCLADARRCFELGADKIIFNSPIHTDPDLVHDCVSRFGAQAVVGEIDVKLDGGNYMSRIANGAQPGLPLREHLERMSALGVGEVMVNSIDRDGTGTGFDEALIDACRAINVPLIVAGGAGKPVHFSGVLARPNVEAAATGNLFAFIGKGFELVRQHLTDSGLPVRSMPAL